MLPNFEFLRIVKFFSPLLGSKYLYVGKSRIKICLGIDYIVYEVF